MAKVGNESSETKPSKGSVDERSGISDTAVTGDGARNSSEPTMSIGEDELLDAKPGLDIEE